MEQQLHRCTAEDGSEIAYSTLGTGPPLVFAAWWLSHLELDLADRTVRSFFEGLAARHVVVRYDRPGVGLSGARQGPLSLAAEVQYLHAVVDDLDPGRFALFGMSCGGPIAVAFAHGRDDVTDLVLYGAYATGPRIADPALQAALPALVEASWGLGVRTLTDVFLRDASPQHIADYVARQRRMASPAMAAALLTLTYEMDVSALLPGISQRTLVLHREQDSAIPFTLAEELADGIPGARLVRLPGATHVPWDGGADAVLRETELFLTGASSQAPGARIVALLAVSSSADPHALRDLADDAAARYGGRRLAATSAMPTVAFDSAVDAIACGRALARELARAGLPGRVGLHAGQLSPADDDAGGVHTEVVAAVAAAAPAGEVLVTGTLADLALGSGIAFREGPVRELPGAPGRWRLLSVPEADSSLPNPIGPAAADSSATFRCEGAVWTLGFAGSVARLPDLKGLSDLRVLLANPGQAVPATLLAGEPDSGEAPPVLDDQAKQAYRARLTRLDAELDSVAPGAPARAGLERERAMLLAELRRAVGLHGRDRRLGDAAERARKAVSARIRDAIDHVVALHPELGAHLRASVRTGATCSYSPTLPVPWEL